MPDLTVTNNLDESIHVAFFATAPVSWRNNLQPGERWTTHLPTLPLYFQVRRAERIDYSVVAIQSREFSADEAWDMGATLGAACVAGTASVVIGVTSVFKGWGNVGVPLAASLWAAANAGEGQNLWRTITFAESDSWAPRAPGRNRYAAIGNDASIVLCETRVYVPWFEHKKYSVRMDAAGRCGLWDMRENRQI